MGGKASFKEVKTLDLGGNLRISIFNQFQEETSIHRRKTLRVEKSRQIWEEKQVLKKLKLQIQEENLRDLGEKAGRLGGNSVIDEKSKAYFKEVKTLEKVQNREENFKTFY